MPNGALKVFGENIGYEVRPSARRQGIAGSIKTILNNGGVFEKSTFVEKWKRETHYYWIDLTR